MCNLHWCYTFCTGVTLFALVLHLNCFNSITVTERRNHEQLLLVQGWIPRIFNFLSSLFIVAKVNNEPFITLLVTRNFQKRADIHNTGIFSEFCLWEWDLSSGKWDLEKNVGWEMGLVPPSPHPPLQDPHETFLSLMSYFPNACTIFSPMPKL